MAQQATVLIIADIGDSERAAVETACAAAGFVPSLEPSAEAATGKLTAKRFDALIVHLGTPGAALACMRARGKLLRTRIPVIALVDFDDEATFSKAYRAGADEVLLLDRPEWLAARLRSLPRSAIPQPGNARGDAVVADADRTRAEVIERVLRDAGFRVEVAVDGFSTRLQAGRPSLKVAVIDASLDDVASLIVQAKSKGARCAWVVRARPEQLDEIREKLSKVERLSVVSAYGPPDDVLFEVNRLIESRSTDGRSESRLLHGSILRLRWDEGGAEDLGYSYNISAAGIFVRTLAAPTGTTVHVDLSAPKSDEKIHLRCEVVWRREFGATRKEPVPAGFALRITGGDVVAWNRVCPRSSLSSDAPAAKPRAKSAAPQPVAESPKPPAESPKPAVTVASDVEIRPREAAKSVEEMLASVLSESTTDDEQPGSAPLNIDGGTVVELHTPARSETSNGDDQVTAVHDSSLKAEALAAAYTVERARQELLSDALDATKTPLAVPRSPARTVPPRVEGKPSLVPRPSASMVPRESRVPRPAGPLRSERAPRPEFQSRAESTSTSDSGQSAGAGKGDIGFTTETRLKSDRPPAENIDLSDITPASIGFDLSEDGRIIEAVRSLPPVSERPPTAVVRADARPSSRPMQSPSRGGTLAGTGRPPPPTEESQNPPTSTRYTTKKPAMLEVVPAAVSSAALLPIQDTTSVSASASELPVTPVPAAAPIPNFLSRSPATDPAASVPLNPSTRVVADRDAVGDGDTVRPSAAGLSEARSEPPPPLAGFSPRPAQSFDNRSSPSGPLEIGSGDYDEQDRPPKRRSTVGIWVAVAVMLGGSAAVLVTPSLRNAAKPTPSEPVATPSAAPRSTQNVQKASEVVAPKEAPAPAEAPSAAAATATAPEARATAAPVPTATAVPGAASTAAPTPTAAEPGQGSEADEAALAALQPGQGYLYVASPLATNVFVYATQVGTTNQRIVTKCGPRFIRLGTSLGNWQGEGQVQIVKCGAVTRVEMGK